MNDFHSLAQSILNIPPSIILVLGALLIPALPKSLRSLWFILLPVVGLAFLWFLPAVQLSDFCFVAWNYADYSIMPYVSDNLSRVFTTAFLLVMITGGIYSWHDREAGEKVATLLYAAGAVGVVLAGDYLTLFVFWELMAIASTWLVWARRDADSGDVGMRYLLYHVLGGGLLLSGILIEMAKTGSIQLQAFTDLTTSELLSNPGALLIFLGVAVNAALVPLHTWVPDAYPKASITGAVFMSALTTKSAIYVLIRLFPGLDILLWIGLVMSLYGTFFALMSNDFRQILSYHIIAQLGYMVAAIGVGTEFALNGATTHAFSHILYKSLLFMAGGALLHALGTSKLSELASAGKQAGERDPSYAKVAKWQFAFYMVGGLSISGLPLLNGFIAKPMIIEAMGEAHYEVAMLVLIAASVGTFFHTGLKIPYFAWISGPDYAGRPDFKYRKAPMNMNIAMGLSAGLCILFGVAPFLLYDLLPYSVDYQPFRAYPIAESLLTMSATLFVFYWLRSKLLKTVVLPDLDAPFRALMPWVRRLFLDLPWAVFEKIEVIIETITRRVVEALRNPLAWLQRGSGNANGTHANAAESFTPAIEVVMGLVLFTFIVLGVFLLL